ncbi:MAG: metal-dependent transcriptional regulator [Candidatus Heimdallarchaeota archaeon]|nr:metal-dependent transcriptional regulator [Candidatus Heimdallarchaeota archaeon]MDH5645881.1 metal-dependent transcriptional regulator [Candidatus Heimdallarchaeota archaeon]
MDIETIPSHLDLSETTENYLKRIYILTIQSGEARISDIANKMGRSRSSVTEAMQRMASEGLVNYEKYSTITLTEKGKLLAKSIHKNFSIMETLLQQLGIPSDIAQLDACSMEHSISKITIDTISKFIEFSNTKEGRELLDKFIEFKIL